MANYSIALGAQPPQIDVGNALALAAQLERQKLAGQQAQQSMDLDRRRFGLQQQQFDWQRSQQEAAQQAAQAQRNALAEYTKAQQGGDENALSRLSAYPELQQRVLQVRNQLAEADRAEFDQRAIRNARRAQSVMGLQGEAKQQAWQGALQDALQAGDITPQMYEQYAAQQPNDLMLQNIVEQAVPIQNLYQAPTPQMQELEAAGIEPGTPEFRERIAPAPLPKFEKVNNRLIRINPDGTTADLTPPLPQGTITEEPPTDSRWRMKNGQIELDETGRPIAEPIPGSKLESVSSETAARVGLADKFINEAPTIRDAIAKGKMNGVDYYLNRGEAADLYRRIEDGSEALVRNLTGAGMNEEEAKAYARRYLPDSTDSTDTVLKKFDNLLSNLQAVKQRVLVGRGIASSDVQNAPPPGAIPSENNDPLGILD